MERRNHRRHPLHLAGDDTAQRDHLVGNPLQCARRPLHQDHLHGLVVHQVDMQRADHLVDVVVLQIGQLLLQPPRRVVVEQRDGAGHNLVAMISSPCWRLCATSCWLIMSLIACERLSRPRLATI
jgi:hypothetical protein